MLLLRPGEAESRRLELGRPASLLGLLGLVLVLLAVGATAGRLWEQERDTRRVEQLEAELAEIRGERERVQELASRLEAIEASYLRIRRAMGGEVAASARDIVLPPLSGADRPATGRSDLAEAEDGAWSWPLARRGFVTRPFGSPVEAERTGHPGLDIAVPIGSYVRSAAAGLVADAGRDSVYGYYVRIAHEDDLSSLYAHNSWIFVMPGDTVERRQVIALSGSTGRSTAPHLHFEIGRNGVTVDPLRYIAAGR